MNGRSLTPPPTKKPPSPDLDAVVAGDNGAQTISAHAPQPAAAATSTVTTPPSVKAEALSSATTPPAVQSSEAAMSVAYASIPPVLPWEVKGVSPHHKQLISLRAPEDEYLMAKFLGDTTYGDSLQSIALRGLRNEIKRMMRDRGIAIEENKETGKLSGKK